MEAATMPRQPAETGIHPTCSRCSSDLPAALLDRARPTKLSIFLSPNTSAVAFAGVHRPEVEMPGNCARHCPADVNAPIGRSLEMYVHIVTCSGQEQLG